MTLLRLLMLAVMIGLVTVLAQFQLIGIAFDKLGLSRTSAYLLLTLTLLGSLINLPVFSLAREVVRPLPHELYRLFGVSSLVVAERTVIAVNLGGAVTPLLFSLYLMLTQGLSVLHVIAVVAVVAAISFLASTPVPGVGVCMPFLVAPLTAALASLILNPSEAPPLAYIGGTLGVIVGADLMHLGAIQKLGTPMASIGGAGTFDGIFLTGLMAVLLA